MKPNVENIKKWIAALRSGEYEQGRGCLRVTDEDGIRFCCLGVACDLHAKEFAQSWSGDNYQRNQSLLPESVCDWLGVSERCSIPGIGSAISLNDGERQTFAQIADALETLIAQ